MRDQAKRSPEAVCQECFANLALAVCGRSRQATSSVRPPPVGGGSRGGDWGVLKGQGRHLTLKRGRECKDQSLRLPTPICSYLRCFTTSATSQRLTLRSMPPVASDLPSGLNPTTWKPSTPSC